MTTASKHSSFIGIFDLLPGTIDVSALLLRLAQEIEPPRLICQLDVPIEASAEGSASLSLNICSLALVVDITAIICYDGDGILLVGVIFELQEYRHVSTLLLA